MPSCTNLYLRIFYILEFHNESNESGCESEEDIIDDFLEIDLKHEDLESTLGPEQKTSKNSIQQNILEQDENSPEEENFEEESSFFKELVHISEKDSTLNCSLCDYKAQSKAWLLRHFKRHRKCENCGKIYHRGEDIQYLNHIKKCKKIDNFEDFAVSNLHNESLSQANFLKELIETAKNNSTLKCSVCVYKAKKIGKLIRHFKSHRKCEQCGKLFVKYDAPAAYERHLKKCGRIIKCLYCAERGVNNIFKFPSYLRKHIENVHEKNIKIAEHESPVMEYPRPDMIYPPPKGIN